MPNILTTNIRNLRYKLFGRICDEIYNAAKKFHRLNEDFPFYIWPGYNSIRYKQSSERRVQLSHFLAGSPNEEMECGISPAYKISTLLKNGIYSDPVRKPTQEDALIALRGHLEKICIKRQEWPCLKPEVLTTTGLTLLGDRDKEVFRFFGTACSIFFSRLLHDPSQDGSFIPGSTHRWLTDNKKLKLIGLSVNYEDAHKFQPADEDYFHIILKAQDLCGFRSTYRVKIK